MEKGEKGNKKRGGVRWLATWVAHVTNSCQLTP